MRLFDKPAGDWSLRELQVGTAVVAEAADKAILADDKDCGIKLQALALVLAEERDRRIRLFDEAEDALVSAYVRDLGPV